MARNRAAVKRRLKEIAETALVDVVLTDGEDGRTEDIVVSYSWDGGVVNVPTLFLGVTTGRTDPESIGNRPRTDDRYTIDGYIAVPGFTPDDAGGEAAEEAAERVLNAFDDAIRSTKALVSADYPSDMDPADFRVQTVTVGQVDGPYHGFPDASSAGSVSGGVTFTIDCLTPTY